MRASAARRRGGGGGFTLTELLVVIAVFVLILAIAVPAFSGMLYSSERSLAENALRTAMGAARNAAARSSAGRDAAAVFFYEPAPGGGRLSIIPCVSVGMLLDNDWSSGVAAEEEREVFVPLPAFAPMQLPRGWTVRGYAPARTITQEWYESLTAQFGAAVVNQGNWLFPETGFYNEAFGTEGQKRQTFMVRFEGGTGTMRMADMRPVVVLAASPSTEFRAVFPWNTYRVDREADPSRFVARVLAQPPNVLSKDQRRWLVGQTSTDTVLARPVAQLALCNEQRLGAGIGARLDRVTGCLYSAPSAPLWEPQLVPNATPALINQWLEGRYTGPGGVLIDSDARLFGVDRYVGSLQDLTGTKGGA